MAQRHPLKRQLDFHGDELAAVERDIAIEALDDPIVARLMTVPGVDVTAVSIVAAVGGFSRFDDPDRLEAYLRLILQSGNGPAIHGRITKAGRAQARGMLVEAGSLRPDHRDRCVRSIVGSMSVAGSKSPPSPPHESWPRCAGTSSPKARTTRSLDRA